MAVAGLGDRPLAAALAGGALAGHEPQVGADRAPVEALPVADLAARAKAVRVETPRRQASRPTTAAQGSLGGLLADRRIEGVATGTHALDGGQASS